MNRVLLSAVLLCAAAAPSFSQVLYNRRILSSDVTVQPTSMPDIVAITVRCRAANQLPAITNLSCTIHLFGQGMILVEAPVSIIIGGGQTCGGSCPTGNCPGSECSDFSPYGGQGCACDIIVTPNGNPTYFARILPHEPVTVSLTPAAGAVPEVYTQDDSFTFTYGDACDPDVNQDGVADQGDVDYLINVIAGGPNPTGIDPDFNQDGVADQGDIDGLINVIAGGPCP
ncbi:MAG: hypothetical protein GC200_07180 [Tepidisphaera sp.]|nr:hypothetical protein [Tepidisphaera sp.]